MIPLDRNSNHDGNGGDPKNKQGQRGVYSGTVHWLYLLAD
jgi:hypothetical protein